MTLDILKADMAAALKNGQTLIRSVLSDAIAAIQKTAIDRKQKDNITEELVNEVLLKEKKIIQEMIDTCPADRTDLLEEYQFRLDIISDYAPHIINDKGRISIMIDAIAAETAIDMSNKGLVMKTVMPRLKGKVDMKVANEVLREMF
jgi:uncharacterized protein YqeY